MKSQKAQMLSWHSLQKILGEVFIRPNCYQNTSSETLPHQKKQLGAIFKLLFQSAFSNSPKSFTFHYDHQARNRSTCGLNKQGGFMMPIYFIYFQHFFNAAKYMYYFLKFYLVKNVLFDVEINQERFELHFQC